MALICQIYKRDQSKHYQIAMVEYNILREVSLAYEQKVSKAHYFTYC